MNLRKLFAVVLALSFTGSFVFAMSPKPPEVKAEEKVSAEKPKVTFVELGSVKCIPCKMMQKVMEEVEKEYGARVKIVFYDVWTEEGKPYGKKYKISLIPTQVFLDENGKEYFRHEGFFPKEEVDKILKQDGVKK